MYYEQKSRLQTITAVLNSATTAMLVIDNHGQITNMNGKAQDVLGVTEENAVGKSYRKVFPDSRIVEETLRGHEVREKIIQYNMNYLVVSSNPILLDGNIIGAVLNIQVGKEIQSIENKLRIKTVSSGYVARSEFSDILGTSAAICTVKERASVYAQVDSTIMLYGESGVGKELFAQSIHNDSKRRNYPLLQLTVRRFLNRCWRASCLAMRKVHLPELARRGKQVFSKWRIAVRFFLTRSERCR